ncbi:hypothetical protein KIN20_034609 [Parelaphostrongylus tenuis]|uniref:Uncharacterized protein n=1 Tax=Parelaphostrongylus tenuis TaxID=148309 RepID=A0AAD5WJS8_PARTN|nr:hypothetical protein KIN20_034609 [Parelaphostrongylus tenuis]
MELKDRPKVAAKESKSCELAKKLFKKRTKTSRLMVSLPPALLTTGNVIYLAYLVRMKLSDLRFGFEAIGNSSSLNTVA